MHRLWSGKGSPFHTAYCSCRSLFNLFYFHTEGHFSFLLVHFLYLFLQFLCTLFVALYKKVCDKWWCSPASSGKWLCTHVSSGKLLCMHASSGKWLCTHVSTGKWLCTHLSIMWFWLCAKLLPLTTNDGTCKCTGLGMIIRCFLFWLFQGTERCYSIMVTINFYQPFFLNHLNIWFHQMVIK